LLADMPPDEAAKYCAENQIARQAMSHSYTIKCSLCV
jgi:hypothetical protein